MLAGYLCGEAVTPPANALPASALVLPLLRALNSSCGLGGAASHRPRVALLKTHKTSGTSIALVLRQLAHRHFLTVLEPARNAIPRLGCPWALGPHASASAPGSLWLGSEGRPPQWTLTLGVRAPGSVRVPGGAGRDERAREAAPAWRHVGDQTNTHAQPQAGLRLADGPMRAPHVRSEERPADPPVNSPDDLGGEQAAIDFAASYHLDQQQNQTQQTWSERGSVDLVASHVLPVTIWYSHRQAESNKTCDRQDGLWVEQVVYSYPTKEVTSAFSFRAPQARGVA